MEYKYYNVTYHFKSVRETRTELRGAWSVHQAEELVRERHKPAKITIVKVEEAEE